jgi:hypothetical protein
MVIYATDLTSNSVILTRHLSAEGDLFERRILLDLVRPVGSLGDVIEIQGYYEDNGDEYVTILDPDTEVTVAHP